MGFELPNGKTARNIQEQVKFLTEKLKDLYAAFNQSGLKKIEIVEELPEVGSDSVLYLVPKEDPETGNYYEEYLWLDNQWELIGTTEIDLSDYVTLSTDQTISGSKTFTNLIKLGLASIKPDDNAFKVVRTSDDANLFYANTYHIDTPTHLPLTNNYYDLGSSAYTWKDLYLSGEAKMGAQLSIRANTNNASVLEFARYGTTLFALSTSGLYPSSSGKDLGVVTSKWNNVYLSGNLSDGTNSVSVAQISPKLKKHQFTISGYSNFIIFYTRETSQPTTLTDLQNYIFDAIAAQIKGTDNRSPIITVQENLGVYEIKFINSLGNMDSMPISSISDLQDYTITDY